MNIAILTQPICNNYGGILQNYALQTVLERRGHTVTTLNFPVNMNYSGGRLRHILSTCRRFLRKLQGDPSIVWIDLGTELKKQVELAYLQRAFIDKHLHLHTMNPPLTWEQVKDMNFNAFVVGSDQVWRPRYNRKFLYNSFLDFVEKNEIKRISYAASLGADVWEMNEETTKHCKQLVRRFNAVSVREASGVGLCKEYLGVDATHVLDPTLLLEAKDYLWLCSGNEHPEGEYIAVYTLDYTKETLKLLESVSKNLNTPLYFIGRFTKTGYPSVESWLEGIANAKFVITDSFHGTVFSIIFQKQFVTLGNIARGNSRFASLFETLGISSQRQCCQEKDIVANLQQTINYKELCELKVSNQQISKQFLFGAGL